MCKRILLLAVIFMFLTGTLFAKGEAEKSVSVGAKNFTEQYIMGNLIDLLLVQNGNFAVKQNFGLSSNAVRKALETGQIDLYADYTGTAWTVYLNHEDIISDPQKLYEAVKQEDAEKNNIIWLDMIPVNNTYALAVKESFAQEHGLKTLSDLTNLVNNNPNQFRFAIDFEFFRRPDGFPAMTRAYGMNVPKSNVKTMEIGLTYEAIDRGDVDVAMVFATDGRLKRFNLMVLKDDKNFFPPYNLAVTVRKEVLDAYPDIRTLLAPLSQVLDAQVMQELNYQVDAQKKEPAEVAEAFLKEKGLIQ